MAANLLTLTMRRLRRLSDVEFVGALSDTGRPGIGPIGAVEKTFSDFKALDGVVLPQTVRMKWDGKLIANESGTYLAVRVSSDLGADFFRAPAAK